MDTEKAFIINTSNFRKGLLGKRKPDLMCYALSCPLQGYLHMLNLNTTLICGHIEGILCNHYWLELSDSRIIDGTASQFNSIFDREGNSERIMPEVYIGAKPNWYQPFVEAEDEAKAM